VCVWGGALIPPCYLAPCHHDTPRPRVTDIGDGLEICRLADNILSKQSRRPKRGGPPALWLGEAVKKKQLVMKCYTGPRNWMDSLERPRKRNIDVIFGKGMFRK
jgi:hypothetical protein